MKPIRPLDFVSILLIIAINLAIGVAVLPDYGESWDEARLYEYAGQSLEAYRALFDKNIEVDFGTDDLRYYGPAYLMGASLFVQAVHGAFPHTPVIDLWHLGNFLCLQFGLLCFYFLLRRFMEILPALSATLLFASQPLIWGHGFINPKDIPFMAFFTASIFFGLMMLEDFERRNYEVKALLRSPWFYAAALLLGLTISIRILGFAAAAVVLVYFVFINARKVLRLSYLYFGAALIVSFLTWPYLWPSPFENFSKSIYAMLKFQWVGSTLFEGILYHTDQLPWSYVPQLLLMQITETALVLFLFAAVIVPAQHLGKKYRQILILFTLWFAVPMLYILLLGMNLYDNTRQLLFILPGAFLLIAIGLDVLYTWIRPRWLQALVLVMIILPGLAGIVQYHPYEYTYYNWSTTSRLEIFRNFETDYWATSFKEIAGYINAQAPENSLVIVGGPGSIVQRYARPDLEVKSFDDLRGDEYADRPYYLVLSTRYDMDRRFFPEVEPVYSVVNNDAVLAVVKFITPQE